MDFRWILIPSLALLGACPSDKDKGTDFEASGPESNSTSEATMGETGASTGPTTGGETTGGESTGGAPSQCAEIADQASCEAAGGVETRCVWLKIQKLAVDMCVLGEIESRCVEIEINDGGCVSCVTKDLGGGQFEVARLGPLDTGCQSEEFESCPSFSDESTPACDCFCPDGS